MSEETAVVVAEVEAMALVGAVAPPPPSPVEAVEAVEGEGEIERVEAVPATPELMACEHAISTARVAAWWRREEALLTKRGGHAARDVAMCGCCTGPCPAGEELCRFCRRDPAPEPWVPYGEASR